MLFGRIRGVADATAAPVVAVLVREACALLAGTTRVGFDAAGLAPWPAAAATLSALAFERTAPRGSGEPDAWLWSGWAGAAGYRRWLRALTTPAPGPEPEDAGEVARDALVAFGRPEALEATRAMEYYRTRHRGRGAPEDLHAWMLDALR